MHQATEALNYIQKNGNIHRDIKAGNLLIDSSGVAQVADFGVASTLLEADQRKVRKTFVGTPCWMAPEVMEMNPHGYDAKADIWSLGITALELALGSAPYAKYPPMKIIYMTLTNPPPSLPKDCERKFSKAFRSFIETCLQKDPSKRPSAEQLLKHPFLKSARKPSYLAENLLNKIIPVHLRVKSGNRDSRIEEEFRANDIPEWTFNPESESPIGPEPGELPDQELKSKRKGRFIVLDDQANICGSTGENTSPSTVDDEVSGCASRYSSISEDQCVRKGRFSLVEESSTHTIKASISDTSVQAAASSTEQNISSSVRIGRFQVDKDDSTTSANNDTMLASPISPVLDVMQLPSAMAHPSHIDQLLLLNDLMRQHLIELRSVVSCNFYNENSLVNHQRSHSSDKVEKSMPQQSHHKYNYSLPKGERPQ